MTKTINWGIIGCGDVTEIKSGPAFANTPGSALVAVMRRDGAKAADYARRHGVPRWYDGADKLINDPEVNAVYVATPPGSHCEYALRVAAAGKACYVEKPMARSAVECRRMVDAFDAAGVPLFVAYYRRALPAFVKVKQLIDAGAIGRLSGVSYRISGASHRQTAEQIGWRVNVEQSGGGIFLDLASHLLDALDYIVGPLENVSGVAGNVGGTYDAEDVVALSFRARGAAGTGLWNFASDVAEDVIEISGMEGRVSWPCFGRGLVRLQRGKEVEEFDLPAPATVQGPLVGMMVDELLGRGQCPSTGVSAMRTSIVMDRVLGDYYRGREDDFWARHDWG